MVILALVYLPAAYYLSSWVKRHFEPPTPLPSLRLALLSPMLILLSIIIFHKNLPRNLVFTIDYTLILLCCFSIIWTGFAIAADILESIRRKSRPEFRFGRATCAAIVLFAGAALYPAHRFAAPSIANAKHKEALGHLKTHNWKSAIKDYDTAILFSPDTSFFYHNRGLARVLNGEPDKALADADKAVRLGGATIFDAHMLKAGILLHQGNYPGAASDYGKALTSRESAEAYLYRAYAHLRNSDYGSAIADSSKFIDSAPDLPDGYELRGLAYRRRAVTSKASPDPDSSRSAIWDILKACDLGNNRACDLLTATNNTEFDYASYTVTDLPRFIGSYKSGVRAMKDELAKAVAAPPGKLDIITLDTAPRKIIFMADYSRKSRRIQRKKLDLIVSLAKSGGQERFASLYKREIDINADGIALWIPVQKNLLDTLNKEFKAGDKALFYAVAIGAAGDTPVLLATEFKTIRFNDTPFFEDNDKIDQYLLGRDPMARFPASVNRVPILATE